VHCHIRGQYCGTKVLRDGAFFFGSERCRGGVHIRLVGSPGETRLELMKESAIILVGC